MEAASESTVFRVGEKEGDDDAADKSADSVTADAEDDQDARGLGMCDALARRQAFKREVWDRIREENDQGRRR